MKRMAIIFLLIVFSAAEAVSAQSGYLSEIKMGFPDQTALLAPSPIFTAGPYDGDYLICVYLSQLPSDTLGASLAWTDENGNSRSAVLVTAGTGATGSCMPIRNLANTAPRVKTIGSVSSMYSLFVVGFGFWKVGPEKQGGITEPISGSYPAQTTNLSEQVLLQPNNYETYLVAMTIATYSSLDDVTATLMWYDEGGWHLANLRGCSGCLNNLVLPIRSMNGTVVTLWTTGTVSDKFDLYVRGVEFGTPAEGSGPVSYYGQTFLDWVNPVSYNEGTVPGGMWVMAANGEYAAATPAPLFLTGFPITVSNEGGAFPTGIAAAYQTNAANESFSTLCGSYQCPEYSAEFNLLVF
jgi:hypothetical protein